VAAVLDQLTAAHGTVFALDLTAVRLEADDTDWSWGEGRVVRSDSGSLVALLGGRTLPDGRALPRARRHNARTHPSPAANAVRPSTLTARPTRISRTSRPYAAERLTQP
jgi:hypothetical protein